MNSILTIDNITKFYGHIRALHNVSFTVPKGCTFGILGPNGSGKTTLLGIIMDVLKPTSGSYSFYSTNLPPHELRKQIGTLLETPNFYHYLTASQNLRIVAEIKGHGLDRIDEVLRRVNLYERRNSRFSTFSLGMKQRLSIASALLADPQIMIFDEPTNGLDPEGIAEVRALIKQLATEGKTIIMASHLLDEVEKVCTHVAILKKSELLAVGKVDEIITSEDIVELSATDLTKLYEVLQRWDGGYNKVVCEGNAVLLFFPAGNAKLEEVNLYCFSQQLTLNKLVLKKKSLESAFFEITNS